MTGAADGLLDGVRVVEFGNLIAAPYAGMILADLGAEVIKVEPLAGDLGRGFGPFIGEESVFFLAVNRGKKSIAVNPTSTEVRIWLDKLIASADVIVNNLRHGAMERMGYGEDAVRQINPTVVYAVVSAFGADGPYADRAGIDVIFQAESGMISVSGSPDGPPAKTATTIGDYVAATNVTASVCAALFKRERTGTGCRVDVSLRDGLLAVQAGWFALYFASGRQPPKTGTASPFLVPNQVFETADGDLALAIVSDRHFEVLADVLDRPDLATRYPTNEERLRAGPDLVAELGDLLRRKTTEDWIHTLEGVGLPVGRLLDFEGVTRDPQIIHNEMIVEYNHPAVGNVSNVGSPLRVDGSQARASEPPPILGQHSREILAGLGAASETIDQMAASGAIVVS